MSNKSRLLLLLHYLQEHTDDQCSVTTAQLQRHLASHGITVTSRTIRDDLAIIADAGYDVVVNEQNGMATEYHIGERVFEKPELQILIDAVSSARFISPVKSERLIGKLISLGAVSDAPLLHAHKLVAEKVKADNPRLYYVIELIDQAIHQQRTISFQYETYTPELRREPRHGGEPYLLSPYVCVWSNDRYYTVGWSAKHRKTAAFRIDLMQLPVITDEPAVPAPADFDVSRYSTSIIKMFDGELQTVQLVCANSLAAKLVDRFGAEGVRVLDRQADDFTAEVTVSPGPTFFGWLLQYGGEISIVAPPSVKDDYRQLLLRACARL